MKAVEKVLDAKSRLGECPRWHHQSGSLYWVDIIGQTLNAWQINTNRTQTLSLPDNPGCFSFCSSDSPSSQSLVLAIGSRFFLLDSLSAGRMTPVASILDDNGYRYGSDGCCDVSGCLWISCFNKEGREKADTWIDCLMSSGMVERKAGPLLATTGIGFSPGFNTFYYADSLERTVYACEYDPSTSELGSRRVFHRFPLIEGMPRGAAIDNDGCYWVAMYAGGKVVRLSPGGVVVEEIGLPIKYPTSVTFGAENNDTLFITSSRDACSEEELGQYPDSGGIFSVQARATGIPETFFQPIRSIRKDRECEAS